MKIVNNLLENIKHIDEQEYTYISVRLKPEYYYMLDLLSHLNGSNISSILVDEIPDYLLKLLCLMLGNDDNSDHDKLIKDIEDSENGKTYYTKLYDNDIIKDLEFEAELKKFMEKLL